MNRKIAFLISLYAFAFGLFIGLLFLTHFIKPIVVYKTKYKVVYKEYPLSISIEKLYKAIAKYIKVNSNLDNEMVDSLAKIYINEFLNNDKKLVLYAIAISKVESHFNPYAVSSVGAVGVMQILPKAHNIKKYKLYNPAFNIHMGITILKHYYKRTKDYSKMVYRYLGCKSKIYEYAVNKAFRELIFEILNQIST